MKMISLSCANCQALFDRSLKDYKNSVQRGRTNSFCSATCNINYNIKYDDRNRVCLQCKNSFSFVSPNQKFCSRRCSALLHNNKRKMVKKCHLCDEIITHFGKYCDNCRKSAYLSRTNGTDYSKITLQELRDTYSISAYHAKLRGHSRAVYKRSGNLKVCRICGYSLQADVCHIKDVKEFPMTALVTEVNHIDNLIALCKNHHWEFDNGFLSDPLKGLPTLWDKAKWDNVNWSD